jgi:hypothetical protein
MKLLLSILITTLLFVAIKENYIILTWFLSTIIVTILILLIMSKYQRR